MKTDLVAIRKLFAEQRTKTTPDEELSPLGRMAACVAVGGRAEEDLYKVCVHCGSALLIKAGAMYFTESKRSAKCDCDWRCCSHSAPGAQRHVPHWVIVPVALGYKPSCVLRTFGD